MYTFIRQENNKNNLQQIRVYNTKKNKYNIQYQKYNSLFNFNPKDVQSNASKFRVLNRLLSGLNKQ